MIKKPVQIEGAPAPIGPYSQAVVTGNLMFLSGQICIDPKSGQMMDDDIVSETNQVMKNIGALLTAYGLTYNSIIKASIFLKDMEDFDQVNTVYASYLNHPYPARETVQVAALPKNVRVEISVIAGL